MYLPRDRFAFCAIDTTSRYAYIEVVAKRDGRTAAASLHRLVQVYPGSILAIQTDNGAEFHGCFQKVIKEFQLPHYFAWVKCPDQNGERLHSRLDWQTPWEHLCHHTHLNQELPST